MSEKKLREVPYHTTDDDSQWCGHVWQQRQYVGGPWGFVWEVIEPYGDAVASGWRVTQEAAEAVMYRVMRDKIAEANQK